MALTLTSSAFQNQGAIPRRYTCEGEDISPALSWSGLPAGAESLALIVDDPDAPDPAAPKMVFTHWVLYNLSPVIDELVEAASRQPLPSGAFVGLNDWRRADYGGPCPPVGRHRYFFRLYVLDSHLPDLKRPDRARLQQAMEGSVLAYTELVGTYQRSSGQA